MAVYFILVCFQPASQPPQNLYSIFGCFLKIVTSSSFSTYTKKKKKCLFFSHIFYQKTHTRINFHFRFILAEYLMNIIQLIVWCFGETHKKSPVIDSHFQTSLETDEDDDEENLFSLTFVQICHKQNNKNKLNIKQWHKGWFDAFLIYFSWEFSFLFSGFFRYFFRFSHWAFTNKNSYRKNNRLFFLIRFYRLSIEFCLLFEYSNRIIFSRIFKNFFLCSL